MEERSHSAGEAAERWAEQLRPMLNPATLLRVHEPLAKKTTLRVGGPADVYVEPASEDDLSTLMRFCNDQSIPVFVLGRGSNLLIRDGGIRGVVTCLAQPFFSRVEIDGTRLRCGAGARLKSIAVEARRHGLGSLEFLEGIPGSIGGALRMNAGAMGSSMFAVVESVRGMDRAGQILERATAELPVAYRSCAWFKTHIALSAVLCGRAASSEEIGQVMKRHSEHRWETQPPQPSAGCIFKNPAHIPAGKLVDELGLKGTRVGAARVSDVHGNFIINEGGASARDVLELIEKIRGQARSDRGIELETEVEIVGE